MEDIKGITETIRLADIPRVSRDILEEMRTHSRSAHVIALSGPLGAGKTTFSQECARQLGVSVSVQSPTFVIAKRYITTDTRFTEMVHIDAYRLQGPEELTALRFEEMVREENTLILIEWAERIKTALPEETLWVLLEPVDEIMRSITYTWNPAV